MAVGVDESAYKAAAASYCTAGDEEPRSDAMHRI